MNPFLIKAIKRAGTEAKLAEMLNEPNWQTVNNWKKRGISLAGAMKLCDIYPDMTLEEVIAADKSINKRITRHSA